MWLELQVDGHKQSKYLPHFFKYSFKRSIWNDKIENWH